MTTRSGARAGKASWRSKQAGLTEGGKYTHERLVRARNSLNKLIRQGPWTYLDPAWDPPMSATTNQIESTWYHASQTHQATAIIPGWGDAICWNELHHTTPYHNTWD